jgi:hypothetical protein
MTGGGRDLAAYILSALARARSRAAPAGRDLRSGYAVERAESTLGALFCTGHTIASSPPSEFVPGIGWLGTLSGSGP